MSSTNGTGDHYERDRRAFERAGPAFRARVQVPRSILKDPLEEPERYAEVVKPLWDSTVELIERDYLAALALLKRLREVHLPYGEERKRMRVYDQEFCTEYAAALRSERAEYGAETTLFEALGLRLVFSTDRYAWRVGESGLVYRWKADLSPRRCSDVKGRTAEIEAEAITYWPETKRQFEATGTHDPGNPSQYLVPFGLPGSMTLAKAEEAAAAAAGVLEEPILDFADELDLRLAVVEAVIERYELGGRVERYDTAVAKPPEVSHAFKLAEDADYCVERACNLIREHGLTLRAAHARLEEEVKGEYPEKSPFFPHYDSIKDAFKTRGIRIADLKGENGGSGGPELSA